MKRKIVAVLDAAASTFGTPFFVVSTGQAVRSFKDEINRPAEDNPLNRHPEDFTLYCLGEYDDETGEIVPALEHVARATDFKE